MRKTVVLSLLVLLLLAACAPAVSGYGTVSQALTVSGYGQVVLPPDIAYITVGVRTDGDDVADVVARNASTVERLMSSLASSGVAREDMQTSNFSVYSSDQYDFEGQRTGVIYYVENTVYVTVRELDRMGELLDDAVSAGANSIWGIQFDVDDRSAAQAEARDLAVADAKAQAEQLAEMAGITLGDLISVSYYPSLGFSPYYGVGGGGGAAYEAAATSIVPGLININESVSFSYEIR